MSEIRKAYNIPVLLPVVLLMLGLNPAYSQEGLHSGFSIGIQNTQLWSKDNSEIEVQNAYCPLVTAEIEYRVLPRVGVHSGAGYALYAQNTGKFRNNFNYLSVPLYLKIGGYKKNDRKFALSFFGGPNFKFLMSANNRYQDEKSDISEYTTGFHLDYTAGAGLNYRINENLILESHLTSSFLGGSFNRTSFDGFFLRNFNFGAVIGFKYSLF